MIGSGRGVDRAPVIAAGDLQTDERLLRPAQLRPVAPGLD